MISFDKFLLSHCEYKFVSILITIMFGIIRACVSSKLPLKLVFKNVASRYTAFKTLKVLTDV